jgi:hypothetical protein
MIHENLESLYKVVPKEYLTSEYGGTVGTIPDLLSNLQITLPFELTVTYICREMG